MDEIALEGTRTTPIPRRTGLRWRIVLMLFALVASAIVAGGAILYVEAIEHRHSIEHEAIAMTVATAAAFDQEVTATAALLKGLSQSPALRSGDFHSFYQQLTRTPARQGSWFVLWSMDRQVLNTARPFNARLPTYEEAGVQDANVNRLRIRGVSISDLVLGPVTRTPTVAVHLRLDDPNGEMNGFLTAVLPLAVAADVVGQPAMPLGWTKILFDRKFTPVASHADSDDEQRSQVARELQAQSARLIGTGHLRARIGGEDVILAYHRSLSTEYTTVTVVPQAMANQPVTDVFRKLTFAGAIMVLAGMITALAVLRQVEPVERSAAETARRLRLAEARYSSLWFDTPESLFIVSVLDDGRFIFEGLNPAHEQATGLRFEEIAGKEAEDCLPPEAAAAVLKRYRQCVATGQPQVYEEILEFPNGRRHWQTSLSPVRDPDTGRITQLVGTARDITEHQEAAARIERSHKLLQATLNAFSAPIAILDDGGTIVATNSRHLGGIPNDGDQSASVVVGRSYLSVLRPNSAHDHRSAVVHDGLFRAIAEHQGYFEKDYVHQDRWFRFTARRFSFAGDVHVVAAHEDITELRSAQQDARDLAERLLSLQEEERRRIASDLHDSTAQHVVAASLGLMTVSAIAGTEVEDAVSKVRASLDEAHKEIRTLSYLLYPPELTKQGLASSLTAYIDGFGRRTGLKLNVQIDPAVDIASAEVQRSSMRVVQEALANVHRHASATKAEIALTVENCNLQILVADNGKGFDVAGPSLTSGVGIPGMQARIRQFGGALNIDSSPERTEVRALVPLSYRERAFPARVSTQSQGFP